MGLLKDAFERLPRPVLEGRGIKVFRFKEITSNSRFKDYAVMESWGWEEVWDDMLDDLSVQTLVQDITELVVKGTSLEEVANNLEELEDRASTHLNTEERTVLLKWLKKNERKLKGVMSEALSDHQINKLQSEYSKINTVDPEQPTYKKLTKHLDSLSQDELKQLAGANIKFVSMLARNRLKK